MSRRARAWAAVGASAALALLAVQAAWAQDPTTTITVSGTVGGSPATVAVNGVGATINGATFTATNVPIAFGANAVTAVATDAAGNSASAQITVHLAAGFAIQGTVSESAATVSVNGVPATVNGTTYTAAVPLQVGLNTISVTATDAAGNAAAPVQRQVYVAHAPIAHP